MMCKRDAAPGLLPPAGLPGPPAGVAAAASRLQPDCGGCGSVSAPAVAASGRDADLAGAPAGVVPLVMDDLAAVLEGVDWKSKTLRVAAAAECRRLIFHERKGLSPI